MRQSCLLCVILIIEYGSEIPKSKSNNWIMQNQAFWKILGTLRTTPRIRIKDRSTSKSTPSETENSTKPMMTPRREVFF